MAQTDQVHKYWANLISNNNNLQKNNSIKNQKWVNLWRRWTHSTSATGGTFVGPFSLGAVFKHFFRSGPRCKAYSVYSGGNHPGKFEMIFPGGNRCYLTNISRSASPHVTRVFLITVQTRNAFMLYLITVSKQDGAKENILVWRLLESRVVLIFL